MEERTKAIRKVLRSAGSNEMPDEWGQASIALLRQKRCKRIIKNYRSIALINSIYKIRHTIMTNRLKQIMNLLTNDTKRGANLKINHWRYIPH